MRLKTRAYGIISLICPYSGAFPCLKSHHRLSLYLTLVNQLASSSDTSDSLLSTEETDQDGLISQESLMVADHSVFVCSTMALRRPRLLLQHNRM